MTITIIKSIADDWTVFDFSWFTPVDRNFDVFGFGDLDTLFWTAVVLSVLTLGLGIPIIWPVEIVSRLTLYMVRNYLTRYVPDYWTNHSFNPKGTDCNGNVGPGLYCFCPSQGFLCGCKHDSYDKKLECYDHQGYDCDGNLIDGEDNWC